MPVELVDQSLVDKYLERINRFVNNVNAFEKSLTDMVSKVRSHFTPTVSETEASILQEAVPPKPSVVPADDIDIDKLLVGIDLGGMSL